MHIDIWSRSFPSLSLALYSSSSSHQRISPLTSVDPDQLAPIVGWGRMSPLLESDPSLRNRWFLLRLVSFQSCSVFSELVKWAKRIPFIKWTESSLILDGLFHFKFSALIRLSAEKCTPNAPSIPVFPNCFTLKVSRTNKHSKSNRGEERFCHSESLSVVIRIS